MVAGSLMKDVAQASARQDDVVIFTDAVPTFILLLEGLLESDPNNRELLTSASQLYVSYGTLVEASEPGAGEKPVCEGKKLWATGFGAKKRGRPVDGTAVRGVCSASGASRRK